MSIVPIENQTFKNDKCLLTVAESKIFMEKYNLITLGGSNAGKTCLLKRIAKDEWNDFISPTIGFNDFQFEIQGQDNPDKKYNIIARDTAGAERYMSITFNYIRDVSIVLLVFDLAENTENSFKLAKDFYTMFMDKNPKEGEFGIIVVGAKYDTIQDGTAKRAVDERIIDEFVSEINAKYIETSSKSGYNSNNLKLLIAETIESLAVSDTKKSNIVDISQGRNTDQNTGCC